MLRKQRDKTETKRVDLPCCALLQPCTIHRTTVKILSRSSERSSLGGSRNISRACSESGVGQSFGAGGPEAVTFPRRAVSSPSLC